MTTKPTTVHRMPIFDWQLEVNAVAREKGWWDNSRNVGETLMLMVTEVAEAMEEWRTGHDLNEVYYVKDKEGVDKPEGFGIELADVAIRVLDACAGYGIDLEKMIGIKVAYNKTRPRRHGGKRA